MMHGPFLFHLNTLIYFLFGDNDTTARLGPALAGLGVLAMVAAYRRYIGRIGALAAGIMVHSLWVPHCNPCFFNALGLTLRADRRPWRPPGLGGRETSGERNLDPGGGLLSQVREGAEKSLRNPVKRKCGGW